MIIIPASSTETSLVLAAPFHRPLATRSTSSVPLITPAATSIFTAASLQLQESITLWPLSTSTLILRQSCFPVFALKHWRCMTLSVLWGLLGVACYVLPHTENSCRSHEVKSSLNNYFGWCSCGEEDNWRPQKAERYTKTVQASFQRQILVQDLGIPQAVTTDQKYLVLVCIAVRSYDCFFVKCNTALQKQHRCNGSRDKCGFALRPQRDSFDQAAGWQSTVFS